MTPMCQCQQHIVYSFQDLICFVPYLAAGEEQAEGKQIKHSMHLSVVSLLSGIWLRHMLITDAICILLPYVTDNIPAQQSQLVLLTCLYMTVKLCTGSRQLTMKR